MCGCSNPARRRPAGATPWARGLNAHDVKRVGSDLIQSADNHSLQRSELKVVTKRAPTEPGNRRPAERLEGRQIRGNNNAIVFYKAGMTMGVGC